MTVSPRASVQETEAAMGIIVPRSLAQMTERRKIAIRTKLFDELRKQYIADGFTPDEAMAIALAKVRAMKFE